MNEADIGWIAADWPAPPGVHAGCTTRQGGVSDAPYDSLNLGDHVGDVLGAVTKNRALLKHHCSLPAEPVWLKQAHGNGVVDAGKILPPAQMGERGGVRRMNASHPEADASYSHHSGVVCAVMTADCLPILLCDKGGSVVAAVHAGWRGLADGVIEATLLHMGVSASKLMAWLGPAIGPSMFEVGDEVRERFVSADQNAVEAFKPSRQGRWLADLYQLARQRLVEFGVCDVYGGHWCTYIDKARFYSYRRDGVTGRMASLIWLGADR